MSTIFDNLKSNIDLSIFGKSNVDPKTPLRRHYLSLVGLLEYVDILNGDITGRNLPDGITEETVKGMIIHCIGDLDTMKAMSAGVGPEPEPEPEPEPTTDKYLTFTAEQADSTVKLSRVGSNASLANAVLKYSTNG